MPIQAIKPQKAFDLVEKGARLVDIRSSDEHEREYIDIEGVRNVPIERFAGKKLKADKNTVVIFHCRSGARTRMNAKLLEKSVAPGQAYYIEGGLNAWKKAGLPVFTAPSQSFEISRQVQMLVGALVAAGVTLGFVISPWFHLVAAFIGVEQLFAGLTGVNLLGYLMMQMPWNKKAHRYAGLDLDE